jgi:hypothetical protein
MWQPPSLTAPVTINVTNANSKLYLNAGQDYVVNMPSTPLTVSGGLWLIGGRNVVVVGGEIRNDSEDISSTAQVDAHYGVYLKNQTGTVHLEGLWIHGVGIGQAIVTDEPQATVQVENCRLESLHPVTQWIHTDGIQSWRGPYELNLYNDTVQTAGVALQVQPRQYTDVALGTWQWHNVNVVQQTSDAFALWKNSGTGGTWWPIDQSGLYVKNLGYLAWSDQNDFSMTKWNPGGGAPITGSPWTLGLRPGGDYVTSGAAGTSY